MRLGSTYNIISESQVTTKIFAGTELCYYVEAPDNGPRPAKRSITFTAAPAPPAPKKAKGA